MLPSIHLITKLLIYCISHSVFYFLQFKELEFLTCFLMFTIFPLFVIREGFQPPRPSLKILV